MKSRKTASYQAITLQNLRSIDRLPEDLARDVEVVGRVLPFKTNRYIVEQLIDWDRVLYDPIFTLTFPRREMLTVEDYARICNAMQRDNGLDGDASDGLPAVIREIRMSLNPNPAGQVHNVPTMDGVQLSGIQHKYRETMLFFPSQGQTCHAFCSFCFRWPQFSDAGMRFAMREADLMQKYLRNHVEISDILFTGGDPLTMSAAVLARYIDPLLDDGAFDHLRTIRIGSKSLSYWPFRFLTDPDSDQLLRLFERVARAGKTLAFQAHFNHPAELSTDALVAAVRRIRGTGAVIRTQSPILAHINDSADIWAAMWRRQVDLGMVPYYMFVPRDTGPRHFFEMPLESAWEVFRQAYSSVSGVCRTVRGPSMSTSGGKVEIIGIPEIGGDKVFALRYLQARDADLVGRPFFARYDPHATWFDQLVPAFDQREFRL